jgi:uncharacterized membrane protein HdeD (DUF308 family)
MESVLDRAAKTASTQLTKMRWALGLNGLFAIAVGVVILAWPGISLDALITVFGVYSLAAGVVWRRSRRRQTASAGGLSSRACSASLSA